MAKFVYREGEWFAVPLRTNGYGLGVVARASRRGVILGYFFGPCFERWPSLHDVSWLGSSDAALVGRFGHFGLKRGDWPVLGHVEDWDRARWPMPEFVRYEELTGRSLSVIYDDNDPSRVIGEYPVTPGVAEPGMIGAGFVEIRLSDLLC